jgi:NAD(P)-dependent dehydrogenase (short-subunit alcohol dehydrogenase family)
VFEDLEGQVAVITGGARGLGLSMGRALARHGVRIGLVDLLEDVHDSAAALSDELGVDSVGATADVTSAGDVAAAFARVGEALRSPSLLVNAAGITTWEDSLDATPESWRRVIDINLTGVFLCCRAQGRRMLAHGGGSIVNVASMSATIANRGLQQAHYNASKAGVKHLTTTLALEWATRGVRVNSLSPGYIETPLIAGPEWTDRKEGFARDTPMGRMGTPDDLVGPVVFLLSDAAAYVTGADLLVDGGFTGW